MAKENRSTVGIYVPLGLDQARNIRAKLHVARLFKAAAAAIDEHHRVNEMQVGGPMGPGELMIASALVGLQTILDRWGIPFDARASLADGADVKAHKKKAARKRAAAHA
jgi:hypothetical protein